MQKVKLERVLPLFKDLKEYSTISYCPAHSIWDFKMDHKIVVLRRYDEFNNKTYFWMFDGGLFSTFAMFGLDGSKYREGTFFKLSGNVELDDIINKKKFNDLLNTLYDAEEAEMEARRAARKAEKELDEKVEELLKDRPFDKLYNETVGKKLTPAQA